MNFLLHADSDGDVFHRIYKSVLLEGILDTLKIIPFLFITYILMELIEHKASSKTRAFMEKSGPLGPLAGGILGAVPQCGFSAAASNFYTGRVITLGMLVSVFLSTSDEMLPIMISGKISASAILAILGYKALVGIIVGFIIDLVLKLTNHGKKPINIDEICDNDNCHCERGVVFSAIHHTLTIGAFLLLITMILNGLVLAIGEENIRSILYDKPVISHIIAAIVGLVPNCAASVALTNLCLEGYITAGTMLSGLFSGAGVGLLVLFRINKNIKENLLVVAILVASGIVFGALADIMNFSALIK